MTGEFRPPAGPGGATLDDLLPEAFAVCREAGRRVLGMRHFDVQLIGGMVLHRGGIAEMKTGEGKTLVATLPVYLNALAGKGVHVVTVNDYLARRDAEWMGRIYKFLGLSVGDRRPRPRRTRSARRSYRCDITYGTNNEFGFDYLRDNMKESIERYVQRDLNYAIVDEVDSILIDEARTPLIISGSAEQSADLVPEGRRDHPGAAQGHRLHRRREGALGDADRRRASSASSSGSGVGNLYDPANIDWLHHVTQALRAHTLYKRDVNYLIEDGKVIIVDEFTGRKMPGRRWSDGLHQAIEAKEGVEIQEENQTLATITFQNYFRMYKKLAGMTGTADTEAEEFHKIYKLDVTVIPTNRPMIAQGRTTTSSTRTSAASSARSSTRSRTATSAASRSWSARVSVEKSEVVASLLRKKGHPAQRAERQAARARGVHRRPGGPQGRGHDLDQHGRPRHRHHPRRQRRVHGARRGRSRERGQARARAGAREAGRYDEALRAASRPQCDAEKQEVLAAGGLHILGTERHESRRIDNQLRGRAGRQGDPGSSRFFLSLEDDLMRIFGAERITGLMERLGMEEDVPIEHGADQPRHRERAEEGRGAQLRHPQEPARVRRRHEPAAQDDLRAAPADPGGALRPRADRGRQEARQDRRRRRAAHRVGHAHAGQHR